MPSQGGLEVAPLVGASLATVMSLSFRKTPSQGRRSGHVVVVNGKKLHCSHRGAPVLDGRWIAAFRRSAHSFNGHEEPAEAVLEDAFFIRKLHVDDEADPARRFESELVELCVERMVEIGDVVHADIVRVTSKVVDEGLAGRNFGDDAVGRKSVSPDVGGAGDKAPCSLKRSGT